jgi:peptidoglycan/LPS O-acetylase OafA/YrhL
MACLLMVQLPAVLQQVALAFCLPYLVLALALAPTPAFTDMARYGDLSYGLYLFGFPIQQLVSSQIGASVQTWQVVLYALPAIVLLAYGSWNLLEKRALALKTWPDKFFFQSPRIETETIS